MKPEFYLHIRSTPGLVLVYGHPGVFVVNDFGVLIYVGQRAENWTWRTPIYWEGT